jgi:predicted permease
MAMQPEIRPPSAGALRERLGGLRMLSARDVAWVEVVARLKPQQSVRQAATAVDHIGTQLAGAYPETNRYRTLTAVRLGEAEGLRTRAQPVLNLLVIAVAGVLFVACTNVAGLLLARAVSRRREVALRVAIGAGRERLVRQWLTESILLGVAGAAAGLVVVYWCTPLLSGLGVLGDLDLSIDYRMLAFTLLAGITTGMIFGVVPVASVLRGRPGPGVRAESSAVITSVQGLKMRRAFVVVQVALSIVLLAGAGLFIRTFREAVAVDLGYAIDRMLLIDITPAEGQPVAASQALYARLIETIRTLPGVRHVGAARVTVLSGARRNTLVCIDGQALRPDRSNGLPVLTNVVSPGYFEAMGIPMLRGRGFEASDTDGRSRVVVVSQSLAEKLWPGRNPIGETLLSGEPAQVVGVVPDTIYRRGTDKAEQPPIFYAALAQNYEARVTLHVRTETPPLRFAAAIRRVAKDLDPSLTVTQPRELADEFAESTGPQRTLALLTSVLSAITLVLVGVGLYGVLAYSVRQRTAEIGLRVALGATGGSILRLVGMEGFRLVAFGTAVGLVGATAGVKFVHSLLFGVSASDPITWLGVCVLLTGVAVIACTIPAVRAMRIAPSDAFRA